MKIKTFISAVFVAGAMLCSYASVPKVPAGEYLIEGELRNVPDSVVIDLLQEVEGGRTLRVVAKDTVVQGRFAFRDTISGTGPKKLLLFSFSKGFPGTRADVWVQSGKYVRITGDDCLLPLWKVSSEVAEQQFSNDFLALCPSERRQSLEWMAQEYDLMRGKKMQEVNWEKVNSLRAMYEPLDSLIYVAEMNYMKTAPVSAVWMDKYKLYASFLQWNRKFGHEDLIRSLYARMSEVDKATAAGREITAYMNLPKSVKVGDEMVDGDLYDLEGNVRHLSEFKGKYILLDFWSMGCGPCVASLPEMEEIAQLYKDKMEVVSISQDSKEQWKSFVAKKKMKGNQWNELRQGNTGLAAAYQVIGIPHYVMIAPDGRVLQVWNGYGKGSLKKKMEELIK